MDELDIHQSRLTTSLQLLPTALYGIPFTKLIRGMPFTPVPPVPPLIEKAGTQLQGGQPDRQTRAPLTPRRTVFLVGQCHRKTNPYQCSIAVDTSSDDICRNKSFNTHCGIGRRVNLAKKEVKWWVTTTSLLRTGYECTSRRIGLAA